MSDLIADAMENSASFGFHIISAISIICCYVLLITLSSMWLYTIKYNVLKTDKDIKDTWFSALTFQDWSCLSLLALMVLITPAWVCLQIFSRSANGSDSHGGFSDTSMQSDFICGNFVLRGVMVIFR
jgi:hypothetical protein